MAKILEVGRSKTQDTPPDHGTNTEYDPLLDGQPVEYIKHVGRYVSSSRNADYEARGGADNALEAAQTHNRETNGPWPRPLPEWQPWHQMPNSAGKPGHPQHTAYPAEL